MSRISQTLSLLSNSNSFSAEPDIVSENDKDGTVTEQFRPRRQEAVFGDQFVFQTTALRQSINAKLVLLAPLPCDVPPFAKSVMYLSSLSGPISATVFRLPGAEAHFFRLYIFARQADVKMTLPPLFRGVVNVMNQDGFCPGRQARYCRAFRDRIQCGLIRMDSHVMENDDEVYIYAEGSIELRLSRNDGSENNIGSRVGRHVRRIFGTP